MTFLQDKRAVSEVVGAILIFGILIAALGVYQAFVVPQANQEAEFKHNVDIQNDFVDLRNSIHIVGATGDSTSSSIQLATDYPSRVIAINPPTPQGILRTEGGNPDQITISNLEAINPDAATWWDGGEKIFDTKHLVYEPQYNLYNEAPTSFIENSVVYHIHENNRIITSTEQRLIQGKTITLSTLVGDRTYSDREANIDITAASGGNNKIAVQGQNGEPIEISIPTQLSGEVWKELLADQQENIENYEALEVNNGVLSLKLDGEKSYELRMSKVGIGPGIEDEPPHYIKRVEGDERNIQQGQTTTLKAQVLDRFNNPVSGVEVEFETTGGTFPNVEEPIVRTDENGEATIAFRPSVDNTTVEVDATVLELEEESTERSIVTFRLNVGDFDIGSQGELNPADTIRLTGQEVGSVTTLTFENVEGPVNLSEARYNLFITIPGQHGAPEYIEEVHVNEENRLVANMERGGGYQALNEAILIDGETDIELHFDDDFPGSANQVLFVVTFVIEDTGQSAQYVIGGTT